MTLRVSSTREKQNANCREDTTRERKRRLVGRVKGIEKGGAPVDAATARASLSFDQPQQVEVLKAEMEWGQGGGRSRRWRR